jgi:hypothetical protein
VIEKAGGAAARCSEAGDQHGRMLEIPCWMFDAAACHTMRRASSPVADLCALAALRVFLLEASAPLSSADASRRLAIASPDQNRGDRNETPRLLFGVQF